MADGTPLNQARALLYQFGKSDLKSLRFEVEGLAVFFSRDPAYRAHQAPAQLAPAMGESIAVGAPHLASVTDIAQVGKKVAAGEPLATLRVLDRATQLLAERGGTIVAQHCIDGALLEYGQAVVSLSA